MNTKTKYAISVMLLTLLVIASFYGKILLAPNSYLFGYENDAMKNYYSYAYFIKNNSSNIEFEGMNYPYKENFMYTDCHPLQASILKFINQYFPIVSDYSIGVLNFFMIFSIVITSLILYLIFSKLKVNKLLSILGALSITILSPQIFRLTGHFALSYSFFIPLTIYILLLFEEKIKNRNILFLILSLLFMFFTHAYLGMIASFFILMYAGVGLLTYLIKKDEKEQLVKHIILLASSVTSILSFYFFVKLFDTHTGRTTNPWGIFENHAEISSVFLPVMGPLNNLKNVIFDNLKQPWEGRSYIGIVAIIGYLTYILFLPIKNSFCLKWSESIFIKKLIFAATLTLFFSMLWPFRNLLFDLVDSASVIKQFRAVGRFAWVFFFSSNILVIYMLDKLILHFKKHKRGRIAKSLLIIVPLIIASEGVAYHFSMAQEVTKSSNLFDLKQTSETFQKDCKNIDPYKYEAIISIPFFYIGSENFGRPSSSEIYNLSFLFSYHLNLPMFNSYLTRTSIHESKNIMQLLGSNFYKKPIKKDLTNNKPFLIICLDNGLSKTDSNLLNNSTLMVKRDEYSLYEIDETYLFKNNAAIEYGKFMSKKATLIEDENFLISDTSLYYLYASFNKSSANKFNELSNCYVGKQKKYNTIFSVKGQDLDDKSNYIARFWMYNNGENYGQDCLNAMIFFQENKSGSNNWIHPLTEPRASHNINGNWSLIEVPLSNIDKNADYDLIVKGNDRSEMHYYIDNLLFYDSNLDVYKYISKSDSDFIFYNNHLIESPSFNKN